MHQRTYAQAKDSSTNSSSFTSKPTGLKPQRPINEQTDANVFVPHDTSLSMKTDWSVQASPQEPLRMEDINKQLERGSNIPSWMEKRVFNREEPPNTPPAGVQFKLTIGQPGDQYEVEADRVADRVMSMPEPAIHQPIQRQGEENQSQLQMQPVGLSISRLVQRQQMQLQEAQHRWEQTRASGHPGINMALQRQCSQCQEEQEAQTQAIQRQQTHSGSGMLQRQANPSIESRLASQKGGGSPLADEVRSFMEPRFGVDFGSVRVHTDGEAVQMNKELGAQAFAHGEDVYFGAGKYDPGSSDGKRLLAHELTHVVQQTGGVQAKSTLYEPGNQDEQKSEQMVDQTIDITAPATPDLLELKSEDSPVAAGDAPELVASNNPLPNNTNYIECYFVKKGREPGTITFNRVDNGDVYKNELHPSNARFIVTEDSVRTVLRTNGRIEEYQVGDTINPNIGDRLLCRRSNTIQESQQEATDELSIGQQLLIGALIGDFNEDPTFWTTIGQIVVGFVPIAGQLADGRDLIAGLDKIINKGGWKEPLEWANLTLILIGLIPGLGDIIKGAGRAGIGWLRQNRVIEGVIRFLEEQVVRRIIGAIGDVIQPVVDEIKKQIRRLVDEIAERLGQRTTEGSQPGVRSQRQVLEGALSRLRTADGHELIVTRNGQIFRCSNCQDIRTKYANVLKQPDNSNLAERLQQIEDKYREAAKIEEDAINDPLAGLDADNLRLKADSELQELDAELGEAWLRSLSPYEKQLFYGRSDAEIDEMQQLMEQWSPGTFQEGVAQSLVYHAKAHGYNDYLEYLRDASGFDKSRADRIPHEGFRDDDTVRWEIRNTGEFLVEDKDGKIRTYGFNEDQDSHLRLQ